MVKKSSGLFSLFLLTLLPGCARIFQWVDCAMYQGEEINDQLDTARAYIRSVTLHRQIETVGRFSAVWVSKRLRSLLADHKHFLTGYCDTSAWALQIEKEGKKTCNIAFYVVALKKSKLEDACSPWHIFLCIAGKTYCPVAIEPINPCTTESLLFRDYITPFSTLYEVCFMIPEGISSSAVLQLYFRTFDREAVLCWNSALEHLYQSQTFCDWRALT